jgi:two-component system copper resistance phosphate regulon response regulator CusR
MFGSMRLLVVEDSDALRTTLAEGLASLGYEIDATANGEEGLEKAMSSRHDAAIVDVMVPGIDGFEMVRRLREAGRTLPVLFLTAKDTVEDRVRGLDLGGDDYMVKPFAVDELLARLRSLLRRGKPANQPMVRVSDVAIDTVQHVVTRGGRLVDLSPREYALLEYLAMRAGTLVTREELAQHVFDEPPAEGSNAVDVLVGRLRRKLCPRNLPDLIRTRRGWGYLLEAGA